MSNVIHKSFKINNSANVAKKDLQLVIEIAKELISDIEAGIKEEDYKGCTGRLNFHINTLVFYRDELVEELGLEFGKV